MKRVFSLFAFTLAALCSLTVSADDKADARLTRMSSKLKSMGEYEASFTVSAGTIKAEGSYKVSGREYRLVLGDVEVFCDGTNRYEVNKALKEVTIDKIDFSERNILNNPVGGLDFIGEEFSSVLLSEDANSAVIRLIPAQDTGTTVIEVTVSSVTDLPTRIVYKMGNDAITVDLTSVRPSSSSLRRFDAKAYPDYEIIDFR